MKSSLKIFQAVFAGETLILGNEKVCLVNKIEEKQIEIKELCPLKKQVDLLNKIEDERMKIKELCPLKKQVDVVDISH